ncbi:MAG: prepilin peptidase [Betaproteobacteria bacterium]|nr:prepilin peptidase [Betaproteobacteria bacterium]
MTTGTQEVIGYGVYPERLEKRENWLERTLRHPAMWVGREIGHGSRRFERLVRDVERAAPEFDDLDADGLRRAAMALRPMLRREGFTPALVARAFALIRAAAPATIGMRHFDVQLAGGWVLLNGCVAEMETGEGKTLTATLAAATAALAGTPVHVVTVNDYLAQRDAEEMGPLYRALGLTIGCVTHHVPPHERRPQYECDITYCTNKDLAFDYLRDRLRLKGRPRPLRHVLSRIAGDTRDTGLNLRGLHFAIVDEVDSVLVDEARTPLILSAETDSGALERVCREALELAAQLAEGTQFVLEHQRTHVRITDAGRKRLGELVAGRRGVWAGPNRREELVRQALSALHLFRRDQQYLVADGKVQIVDEFTGRVMPDRSWERGLHQMIEVKEGCALTGQRETLARISYQRFFRRYIRLAGMTGTAKEISGELWSVYRLKVMRVPTRRPVQRRIGGLQIFDTADDKWRAVLESVQREHTKGRPVLVGTRSVAASERLSALLTEAGLAHRLLNARQDREEADIVSDAGQPGRITVATNMAGRGTDIKLAPDSAAAGGLHVIVTELHEAGRIDRQLFGRCARQGDPGTCEVFACYEDELISRYASLAPDIAGRAPGKDLTGPALFRFAQRRAERIHAMIRQEVLEMDDYLGDLLAFAGRAE